MKDKFSFAPHALKKGKDDTLEIDKEASLEYIMLGSQTQGTIYYTPKTNQYWAAPGKEMSKERFKEQFEQFLSWDYDKVEDEIIEKPQLDKAGKVVEDAKGKVKLEKVATGNKVNVNPPSPENILKKRQELLAKAMKEGKSISEDKLIALTSPRRLKNKPEFEARLNNFTSDELLIRRLNKSKRY